MWPNTFQGEREGAGGWGGTEKWGKKEGRGETERERGACGGWGVGVRAEKQRAADYFVCYACTRPTLRLQWQTNLCDRNQAKSQKQEYACFEKNPAHTTSQTVWIMQIHVQLINGSHMWPDRDLPRGLVSNPKHLTGDSNCIFVAVVVNRPVAPLPSPRLSLLSPGDY